jgi:hypothetical protein
MNTKRRESARRLRLDTDEPFSDRRSFTNVRRPVRLEYVDTESIQDLLLAAGVTVAGLVAAWTGCKIARLGPHTWLVSILIPLTVLVLTSLALNYEQLAFMPPTSWLVGGAERWMSLTLAGAMTLGALAAKVKLASQRRALLALSAVVVLRCGTLPFAGPIFSRPELRTIKTHVTDTGICFQSTYYNCGPAATVTALRRLGFPAEEGQIGLMCKTDPFYGTADDRIVDTIRKLYGAEGLIVEHRYVKSIDELRQWPVAVAVIHHNLFIDHYVAVLAVDDDTVTVGDPWAGRERLKRADFEKKWNHVAILLDRRKVEG